MNNEKALIEESFSEEIRFKSNVKINFFLGSNLTVYIEKIEMHYYPYVTYVSLKSKVVLPTVYLKKNKDMCKD